MTQNINNETQERLDYILNTLNSLPQIIPILDNDSITPMLANYKVSPKDFSVFYNSFSSIMIAVGKQGTINFTMTQPKNWISLDVKSADKFLNSLILQAKTIPQIDNNETLSKSSLKSRI